MAKGAYVGVGGVARSLKAQYVGVGGVARTVKNGYVGVGGVARACYDEVRRVRIVRHFVAGSFWPAENTTLYAETATSKRAEMIGAPTENGEARSIIGYRITGLSPGDYVSATFSANAGGPYSDNVVIYNGEAVWSSTTAQTNTTVSVNVGEGSDVITIVAQNGITSLTSRWIEITKVTINGEQFFPTP